MNVMLSGDAEHIVRAEVASGRYDSAQQVVREALRLFQERAIVEQERRGRLNEQIEEGLAQLDRGEGVPGDRVFRALRERSREGSFFERESGFFLGGDPQDAANSACSTAGGKSTNTK